MNKRTASDKEWDIVIKPRNALFNFNFTEIWRYKDLLVLFVKRDFTAQYKQTILGPLWHLIQPVFTTVMFLIVFNKIAKIPTDGLPPILFYISGITVWSYFSACLINTSNTFIANASIFGKVYFPRLIIPLSVVSSNVIKFGIQFLLLLVTTIYFHFNGFKLQVSLYWLLIPLLVIMMALLGLGLGIIISSLTTKYRDFTVLITFGVQLLMYITPIAYPMSFLENSKFKTLIQLNPLTAITETFRYALFKSGKLDFNGLAYSMTFIVLSLIIGLLMFNRVEKNFMDTV